MDRKAVRRLVDEFARHTDWCAAWCPGNEDHGAHREAGKACTCGLDETVKQALGEVTDEQALLLIDRLFQQMTAEGDFDHLSTHPDIINEAVDAVAIALRGRADFVARGDE